MARISFLLLILLFAGCSDEQIEPEPELKESSFPHYGVAQPEVEPEPPKPEPIVDDGLPDDDAIIATRIAAHRLGQIRKKVRFGKRVDIRKDKEEVVKETFLMQDEDYSHLNIPSDISGYPVNRDRILTKDMVIPAILESGINSQIPGRVIAKVYRDIYSPTMKYILLPTGTRIICSYQGLSSTGQTRLSLNCSEIIRPDGAAVNLSGMTGSDMSGKQGLIGRVDNRMWQQYGAAFVIAGISALSQTASKWTENSPYGTTMSQAASSLSNQLGTITAKVLEKNLDLRPIIVIEPGERIILRPEHNIVFKKPERLPKIGEKLDEID